MGALAILHVYEHSRNSESHRLICNSKGDTYGASVTISNCPAYCETEVVMDSSSSDDEKEDGGPDAIGRKLDRIRAAQQARDVGTVDSDVDDSDNDARAQELRWKQAKLSHSDAGNSQDFSQDLSQSSQYLHHHPMPAALGTIAGLALPVPVYRTLRAEEAARHEMMQYQSYVNAQRPPLAMPDYRVDPMSPWAIGGTMHHLPPVAPATTATASDGRKSRAASPSSRAASPATSIGNPKPPAKRKSGGNKSTADILEEEKLQREIEMVITHFKPEYKHRIDCEDERDMKNMEDQELYKVARWLNVNKPVPRKFDLAKFNSKQIRRLAVTCQVRGGGNLTLFQCRRKIAMSITMGTVYDDETISNPKTTTLERKTNTLMRIINACFHSDMKDKFVDLNDSKKRAAYEAAHGGNPVKDFWVQVSEFTNDSTRNDVLGVVLESREGEDEHGHMSEWVDNGEFNLNDFTLQTYVSCQQHMSDCMKARENCLKQLRTSGHNSNDMYDYCIHKKFTQIRKNSAPVPAKAVYYCHLLSVKHPEIDGKFAAFLSEKLKSDSAVDLTGNAGERSDDRSDKKNKALDTLVMTLATATTEMTSFFAGKKVQQQQEQQPIVEDNEARDRLLWSEYLDVAGKFLAMKEQSTMLPLLCNFAIRIRKLERLCGIPSEQSVTVGVAGIPIEVVTTVATAETSTTTSDVTSNK
jgi:hypothetical protein